MEIILSIVVVILKILNYVDVMLQKFGIKMYSITKESLLQGLSTNILIFISKSSYVITEVDFRRVSNTCNPTEFFYHFTVNEVQAFRGCQRVLAYSFQWSSKENLRKIILCN